MPFIMAVTQNAFGKETFAGCSLNRETNFSYLMNSDIRKAIPPSILSGIEPGGNVEYESVYEIMSSRDLKKIPHLKNVSGVLVAAYKNVIYGVILTLKEKSTKDSTESFTKKLMNGCGDTVDNYCYSFKNRYQFILNPSLPNTITIFNAATDPGQKGIRHDPHTICDVNAAPPP